MFEGSFYLIAPAIQGLFCSCFFCFFICLRDTYLYECVGAFTVFVCTFAAKLQLRFK